MINMRVASMGESCLIYVRPYPGKLFRLQALQGFGVESLTLHDWELYSPTWVLRVGVAD